MSAVDYPVPSAAAYIWIANGALHLGLPGTLNDGVESRPHTVVIPLDKIEPVLNTFGTAPVPQNRGLAVMISILKQRMMAAQPNWLGSKGAPPRATVQAAVESDEKYAKWLESMGAQRVEKKAEKEAAKDFLAGLGL